MFLSVLSAVRTPRWKIHVLDLDDAVATGCLAPSSLAFRAGFPALAAETASGVVAADFETHDEGLLDILIVA